MVAYVLYKRKLVNVAKATQLLRADNGYLEQAKSWWQFFKVWIRDVRNRAITTMENRSSLMNYCLSPSDEMNRRLQSCDYATNCLDFSNRPSCAYQSVGCTSGGVGLDRNYADNCRLAQSPWLVPSHNESQSYRSRVHSDESHMGEFVLRVCPVSRRHHEASSGNSTLIKTTCICMIIQYCMYPVQHTQKFRCGHC